MQKQMMAQKLVRRIDDAARDQETQEYEEVLSKARRARKHAHRATALAMQLVEEIERVV